MIHLTFITQHFLYKLINRNKKNIFILIIVTILATLFLTVDIMNFCVWLVYLKLDTNQSRKTMFQAPQLAKFLTVLPRMCQMADN